MQLEAWYIIFTRTFEIASGSRPTHAKPPRPREFSAMAVVRLLQERRES